MTMVLITALGVGGATIIGAIIGFIFKEISHKFSDIVLSFAAGVMLAAAVFGLIIPSIDYGGKYGVLITIAGIFVGALCLNLIDKLVPHLHKLVGVDIEEHGPGGIGIVSHMDPPAGKLPDEPGFNAAEEHLAAHGALVEAVDVLEHPRELRRRQIARGNGAGALEHEGGLLLREAVAEV